jgi:hypothetical protein
MCDHDPLSSGWRLFLATREKGASTVSPHDSMARSSGLPDPSQAADQSEREAWITLWLEREVLTVDEIARRFSIGIPEAATLHETVVARSRAMERIRARLHRPDPAAAHLAWLLDRQGVQPGEEDER